MAGAAMTRPEWAAAVMAGLRPMRPAFWTGYVYPDSDPPTPRLPSPGTKCECGSGSDARSGAHSHWCPCWVAP